MPEAGDSLKTKIEERLRFYEDLGIGLFYRDRTGEGSAGMLTAHGNAMPAAEQAVAASPFEEPAPPPQPTSFTEESLLPKSAPKPKAESRVEVPAELLPKPSGASLFESVEKVKDDTLFKIREDIGECTRCKLHKGRHKIVFGDGNPKAELMFVGEGPGADEDAQGLPFVGRAGKLLTQMIEAMGLQRKDVYICNVVKCRPPENRAPEPAEVATCSPYLLRQIDTIQPKVIVCLGAVAAKTLLQTTRGISQFRGQWLEWRGHKLMATYHPAYLLRNPPAKADVWKDLQKVMTELGLAMPKRPKPA